MTHGWIPDGSSGSLKRFTDLADKLQAVYGPEVQVVMVVWEVGATSPLLDPWQAASNIPVAAQKAFDALNAVGCANADTIYIGESYGNAINAYISANASEKGSALILNPAVDAAFPASEEPSYKTDFSHSVALVTPDLCDEWGKVADRTLWHTPVCGGVPCNILGESHTSQVGWLLSLLDSNLLLAKGLIEGTILFPDNGPNCYDGYIDELDNLFTDPSKFPSVMHDLRLILQYIQCHIMNVRTVRPIDPNDKIGPVGFGDGEFVLLNQPLAYTIYFENDPSASAAAREVQITDTLSANLDWTSFELGDVDFGATVIAVPPRSTHYETSLPIDGWTWNGVQGWHTGETPLIVTIVADLDAGSGQATWLIACVDANTGLPPEDAYAGFLPPDDAANQNPRGEGHVGYVVGAKPGLVTGAQINNSASIAFDFNLAIDTPAVVNTIDNGPPSSSVAALPANSPETFPVQWSGQDDPGGCGIASYDVYVSIDDGPMNLWLTTSQTSALYVGEPCHSYAFYSVATDYVGNVESLPSGADATTWTGPQAPGAPEFTDVSCVVATVGAIASPNGPQVEHALFETTSQAIRWSGRSSRRHAAMAAAGSMAGGAGAGPGGQHPVPLQGARPPSRQSANRSWVRQRLSIQPCMGISMPTVTWM